MFILKLKKYPKQCLLCCWLLFFGLACFTSRSASASPQIMITQSELNELKTIYQKLEMNNQILLTNLQKSKTELTEVHKQLKMSKQELALLKKQLNEYKLICNQAKISSMKMKNSLDEANKLLTQYQKEMQSKERKLKMERNLGYAVGLLGLLAGISH